MEPIWGSDVVVSLYVADVPYPVFCATDMQFRSSQEIVLASTANSGLYRKKRLRGLIEWSVTTSGLTKIDNTGGQISFFYLLQENIRGSVQTIKIDFTDADGNEQTISGEVIIPDLGINAPVSDFSTADVTFEGTGELSMEAVPDPVPATCEQEDTLYILCVEGETSVHDDLLMQDGVVILAVARTGTTLYETTGTPGNMEFKADLPAGDILTDPSNPYNTGEWIAVEYKIEL